jgi:hypothetical protein
MADRKGGTPNGGMRRLGERLSAEVFTGTELLANANSRIRQQLYYWHREQRGSNAETDYVVQLGNSVVPVEVKSGRRGSMQSMRMFLDSHPSPYGIRTAMEPFAQYGDIQVIPLYALWKLVLHKT